METIRMSTTASARVMRKKISHSIRFLSLFGFLFLSLSALVTTAGASDSDGSHAHDDPQAHANDPMTLIISLSTQQIRVYRGDQLLHTSRVSTGRRGYATPAGIYSILEKRRYHRSNIYSRAPMPYMQRITWSGIALHEGRVPNSPASHGCIRLPAGFAGDLFGITERGIHVLIAHGEPMPRHVAHDALFQPPSLVARPDTVAALESNMASDAMLTPAGYVPEVRDDAVTPASPATAAPGGAPSGTSGAAVPPDEFRPDFEQSIPDEVGDFELRSSSPLRILITRRTGREQIIDVQTLLTQLGYDPGEIDGYMGPMTGKAILAFQKDHELQPTGAFSELLLANLFRFAGRGEVPSGHIYVRQDYKDLFDAPMRLSDPEAPLGTHIYTAMDFVHDGEDVQWVGVTLEPVEGTDMVRALDRVADIPRDIRTRIADMLTPGSSLIISDHGLGRETGRGTDFIVQPR